MIYFSELLQEILTPDQKKTVDRWEKGDNSFSDHLFNKPSDKDLTIPLEHPDIKPWHKRSALARVGIKQEQDN